MKVLRKHSFMKFKLEVWAQPERKLFWTGLALTETSENRPGPSQPDPAQFLRKIQIYLSI